MAVTAIEKALNDGMDRAAGKPLVWGRDDCALFIANIVHAATGRDFAAPYRGRYKSEAELIGLLSALGVDFHGLMRRLARTHGWSKVEPCGALVGDIGLTRPTPALVIRLTDDSWIGREDLGIGMLKDAQIKYAWSIPEVALCRL